MISTCKALRLEGNAVELTAIVPWSGVFETWRKELSGIPKSLSVLRGSFAGFSSLPASIKRYLSPPTILVMRSCKSWPVSRFPILSE